MTLRKAIRRALFALPLCALASCGGIAGETSVPGGRLDETGREEVLAVHGLLSRLYVRPEEIPPREKVWTIEETLAPLTDRWTFYFEPKKAEEEREEEEHAPVDTASGLPVPTVWSFRVAEGITLLRITQFKRVTMEGTTGDTSGTWLELRRALAATDTERVTLVDLRSNPGGNVELCLNMADEFVPAGRVLLKMENRAAPWAGGKLRSERTARGGGIAENRRFVFLANGGSASCSEIFLAAVRGNRDDPLVGERTYGKGIGQSVWNTPAGGQLRVTSLRFLGPNDESWDGTGLLPDVEVSGSAAQLQRALAEARKILALPAPAPALPDSALRTIASLPAAVPAVGAVAETAAAAGAALLALERPLSAETEE